MMLRRNELSPERKSCDAANNDDNCCRADNNLKLVYFLYIMILTLITPLLDAALACTFVGCCSCLQHMAYIDLVEIGHICTLVDI